MMNRFSTQILVAVAGLAFLAATGAVLGIPPQGLVLALTMIVCSAAMVQAAFARRKRFDDQSEPVVTLRRKHFHGQDTMSGPMIP